MFSYTVFPIKLPFYKCSAKAHTHINKVAGWLALGKMSCSAIDNHNPSTCTYIKRKLLVFQPSGLLRTILRLPVAAMPLVVGN